MPLQYESGIEICQGDLVTYAGGAAEIELLVDGPTIDPWLFEQHGAGVMVRAASVGRVYLTAPEQEERLGIRRQTLVSVAAPIHQHATIRHRHDARRVPAAFSLLAVIGEGLP